MDAQLLVRPVDWSVDRSAVAAIDTTFTTDRIYRVERAPLAFTLAEQSVSPPLQKTLCHLGEELDDVQKLEHVVVAEVGGEVVGLAAANLSEWNRWVVLWHLYIQPAQRDRGVGRALLQSVDDYARRVGAWCIFMEAQNVNYPAIQFYFRHGYRVCGLDIDLYDPAGMGGGEVAVFLTKQMSS